MQRQRHLTETIRHKGRLDIILNERQWMSLKANCGLQFKFRHNWDWNEREVNPSGAQNAACLKNAIAGWKWSEVDKMGGKWHKGELFWCNYTATWWGKVLFQEQGGFFYCSFQSQHLKTYNKDIKVNHLLQYHHLFSHISLLISWFSFITIIDVTGFLKNWILFHQLSSF